MLRDAPPQRRAIVGPGASPRRACAASASLVPSAGWRCGLNALPTHCCCAPRRHMRTAQLVSPAWGDSRKRAVRWRLWRRWRPLPRGAPATDAPPLHATRAHAAPAGVKARRCPSAVVPLSWTGQRRRWRRSAPGGAITFCAGVRCHAGGLLPHPSTYDGIRE